MAKAWTTVLSLVLRHAPKIAITVLILIVAGLGYNNYQEWKHGQEITRRYEDLVGKTSNYEQLTDEVAKLRTDYADQAELREKLIAEWGGKEARFEDRIKALADATFTGGTDSQDIVLEGNLLEFQTRFYKDGKFGPWVAESEIVKLKIINGAVGPFLVQTRVVPHEISIKAAITKDEVTGEINIFTKGFWIQKDGGGEWLNKPYALNIIGGSITIDPTEPINVRLKKKFRLAPHINIGNFVGVASNGIEVGFHIDGSIWGYGRTDNDLDYKLGQLGVNFTSNYVDANLVPISYNIGNHLPFVSDIYVGPGIGFGTAGTIYFLSLSTTL